MQFTRRDLLQKGGLAALALCALSPASKAFAAKETMSKADQAALDFLDTMAEEVLALYPENATALGIDTGVRSGLRSRLADRSKEAVKSLSGFVEAKLKAIQGLDMADTSPEIALHIKVVKTVCDLAVKGLAFPYGDMVILNSTFSYRNTPYVVAQNTGAFVEIPDFLDSQHKVNSPADAEAYLERVKAYAQALDDETVRLKHDSAGGVILPSFLLDKTIGQLKSELAKPISTWVLVQSIIKKTAKIGGQYGEKTVALAESLVAPALARQVEELIRQRGLATEDAGVWKLPDGDAYYAWALKAATTSNLTPDEIHEIGLEQVKYLGDRMDGLLKKQGLTKGTVGERMTALGKDPKYRYPNNDEGRAQILAYVNACLDDIRTRLPKAFHTMVPGNLEVKRVPPAIENGAPDGYAGPGSMDGSTPGYYYINLRDTSIWPRYSLPTLSFHEGIPGHIWQGEYTYKLPLMRSLLAFNAYSEGWALYAEQLADELGVYADDPIGELGYLQSISFRACRLVVDTGLHAKRWSRDKAIKWFAETNGSTEEQVSGEVDRYCVWPGQACGYKIGHTEINRLRSHAKEVLGDKFSLPYFDDAVVRTGSVPLTLLDEVVKGYIASAK